MVSITRRGGDTERLGGGARHRCGGCRSGIVCRWFRCRGKEEASEDLLETREFFWCGMLRLRSSSDLCMNERVQNTYIL
jgi:hypothetical protein